MATVRDPVCGMTIDSETAKARTELNGQTYYFCSSVCATAFEANPDRYVTQASQAPNKDSERIEEREPPYTTRGILTSPKFGAAGSGGLEYERPPEADDRT